MRPKDLLDPVLLKDPGRDNGFRAFRDFFRGLEDPDHGAGEVAMQMKVAKRPHEPRLMTVVTAGVGEPRFQALPGVHTLIIHFERVDIGPKPDHRSGAVPLNPHNDTVTHELVIDIGQSPSLQDPHDPGRRFRGLKPRLRMLVNFVTDRGEFIRPPGHFGVHPVFQDDISHGSMLLKGIKTNFCVFILDA